MQRRLSACLRTLRARSEEEARHILEQRPQLLTSAVSSLLIGVTEFFRDPGPFEFLRTQAIPECARRSKTLFVWSAACANGAELASVAILLAEAGLLGRSRLLGTDCRCDAIEEARRQVYPEHALRLVPASLRRRYFRPEGPLWRLALPAQRQISWQAKDVFAGVETGPWDIILCRNVAIYLKAEAAAALWRNLVRVLKPGGLLIVGKAERPSHDLGLQGMGRCVYRAGSSE